MNLSKIWAPQTECLFDSSLARVNRQEKRLKLSAARPTTVAPDDLVSICVTVFNYEQFLPECMNSVREQTHKAMELIIVDDASDKDQSAWRAKQWAEENRDRFFRVLVHRHLRNQGPAEARNTSFRLASGNYIFILDADNAIYPRAIARLFDAINAGDGFDATYSQIVKFGEERAIGSADIWDVAQMLQDNYVDVMALLRRSAWTAVDGFSHVENGWEDYDFWLKFIGAGLKAAYVPEILCRYRVHGQSRTVTEAHRAHDALRVLMAFRHPGFGIDTPPQTRAAKTVNEVSNALISRVRE